MALSDPDIATGDGLIVVLPAAPGGEWRWRRVEDGVAGTEHGYFAGEDAPWGSFREGRVTAVVPAALAPVRIKPMPAMPAAQALAAERLGGASQSLSGDHHVAVAASEDGKAIYAASVALTDMDLWLAQCAAAGLEPAALVPAALALPQPASGAVVGELAGQPIARTAGAAFAGEPALVEALAAGEVRVLDDDALADALLAAHRNPPLNLRQGQFAPRRVSFLLLPDWMQLARMTAVAALLALALMLVWTVKWNLDSAEREDAALAAVQQRFPAATDLDTAERLVSAELARRGQGGAAFSGPASALLAAMKPAGAVKVRDLGYSADGTLRFTAASPRAEDINQVLYALQRDGWKITVPPSLAPDPTGATVAAITVRAP